LIQEALSCSLQKTVNQNSWVIPDWFKILFFSSKILWFGKL